MPAANQGLVGGATVRMRSTGVAQSAGGAGTSTSSIRKSPSGWSGTPTTAFVLRSTKGATASQISVAKTLALAVKPMRTPPPSSRPLPSTWRRPSAFTSAVRAEITQIWPAGWTPRTMLRFTRAVVGTNPTPLATGMTPIPPRNFTRVSSATADSGNNAMRNGTRTKALFMVVAPLPRLGPPGLTGHVTGGGAEERAATALGVQRGDAVRSSLGLRLPEHIVGDFAVIPTLHVHATVRRAQLGGGLGVGGRVTRAVRIRSPGRLTYRAHADSARAGTRTGGRNQAQQHHERDPQELRSLIHSLLQLVRCGMKCTRICGCDADRGMRATQTDSFRKNS